MNWALCNSEFVLYEDIRIPLSHSNYASGNAVYEIVKVRDSLVYFLDLHIERLLHSANILDIRIPYSAQEIKRQFHSLHRKHTHANCNYRILIVSNGAYSPTCYMHIVDIPRISSDISLEFPEAKGTQVCLYRGERHFPRAKSMSQLLAIRARAYAREHNCWDALLVDSMQEIREGSRSSLYWLDSDRENPTVFVPNSEKILQGITSINFVSALAAQGVPVQSARLSSEDFLQKQCPLFISSTSSAIQPILAVLDLNKTWHSLAKDERIIQYAQIFKEYLQAYKAKKLQEKNEVKQ